MQAHFANLYLVLQQKIKTLVSYIDEDTGQLADEVPGLNYPCILINFDDVEYSSLSENCKMGVVNINFKLVLKPPVRTNSNANTPIEYREKAISHLEIESQLHAILQGWSPSDEEVPVPDGQEQPEGWDGVFGALDKEKAITNKQRADLSIREITYSLGFEDYTTALQVSTHPATIKVVPDIVPAAPPVVNTVPGFRL